MGKIDKEKLLKELPCAKNGVCEGSSCLHFTSGERTTKCITKIIKNFPEEPEIDFDALCKEFLTFCDAKTCGSCEYVKLKRDKTTACFVGFLKSKNLCAPKPFEIPVKKTWKVKSEIVDMFTRFKISIEDYVKLELPYEPDNFIKQYYDLHEEPDYSAIPKGSIVELKNSLRRLVIVFNGVLGDKICGTQNDHYTIAHYEIRVVELAKEGAV